MLSKALEKEKAIALRKQGFSYSEILREISVAKSTLSVWLQDVGIAKHQRQRLTEKRLAAQKKAQETCKKNRIEKESKIISKAKGSIGDISQRELLLIGATLYWAEGSKQKEHNVSQCVSFGNSDPKMVLIFKRWLHECCDVSNNRLVYRIYIHETADLENAKRFWSEVVNAKVDKFYLKKHNPKTLRKNISNEYNGLLRIDVRESTDLNRKIKGWILGIIEN